VTLTESRPIRATPATGRIVGLDLARALAMLGMVIAHYVWRDQSGDAIDLLTRAMAGRAMPLFVMLGGVGATILTSRSATPDRALLIRAAMLFPLGVALQEATTVIAIILQSYAVFFVAAVVVRRLPTPALLAGAAALSLIGGWTHQDLAASLTPWNVPSEIWTEPTTVLGSLLFGGSYPFFPVFAFFLIGMVLGRLDLRSEPVAIVLAVGGVVVGLGTIAVSRLLVEVANIDRSQFIVPSGRFTFGRLLDTTGHSAMPGWVISATGTSVAVLGLCLLLAPRVETLTRPFVALGQLALTFYAFQAVLIRYTPSPDTTPHPQELLTALAIFFGFMLVAVPWRRHFRSGPLEAALRIGSRRKRPAVTTPRQEPARSISVP